MNLSLSSAHLRTHPATPKTRVVLFDDFTKFDQPGATNHGDPVEFELKRDFPEAGPAWVDPPPSEPRL